ncbi:hypothetical protein HYPSUDRAFT_1004786 [Hypholoma sublateritium FD-334 SS-4]|uniref:protein-tyrosine-phosphatase n=1 Tax=Hypholoma sublateritium (strain FD-334 SS-4) TaxID=945553 RepID=A0A0D2PBS4_HYPSF|nr:hypothetical protein HYPSUDRAFT_1004786 [Hypholoma sublateritium FD-334 SS-4]
MTVTTASSSTSTPSITEILKNKLYLGNLSAALSVEEKQRLSISHIVSVCPNYQSTGPTHLNISIEDTEYDDLLINLPQVCAFIQDALDHGGRVLVHCVMGISRSSAAVAAFLMKTKNMSLSAAIFQLKKARPQVHLNYGFIKQLDVFAKCEFQPSVSHPVYISWKRRHIQDATRYLNYMADTVSIIPDKLLLTSEFPTDCTQSQSLLLDLGITHVLSISPAKTPSRVPPVVHHHITVSDSEEDLLMALPGICAYIHKAMNGRGLVLVQSMTESRACLAACAYLMSYERYSAEKARRSIQEILPLFNSTRTFIRTLDLFQACGCQPTLNNPALVVARDGLRRRQELADIPKSSSELQKTASSIIHDTGLDMKAFGEALTSISKSTSTSFIRIQRS